MRRRGADVDRSVLLHEAAHLLWEPHMWRDRIAPPKGQGGDTWDEIEAVRREAVEAVLTPAELERVEKVAYGNAPYDTLGPQPPEGTRSTIVPDCEYRHGTWSPAPPDELELRPV